VTEVKQKWHVFKAHGASFIVIVISLFFKTQHKPTITKH